LFTVAELRVQAAGFSQAIFVKEPLAGASIT
jgi:hypothetical protein